MSTHKRHTRTHLPPFSFMENEDAGIDAFSFAADDASLAAWGQSAAKDDVLLFAMERHFQADFLALTADFCSEETAHDDVHTFASESLEVMTRNDHAPDTAKKAKKKGV